MDPAGEPWEIAAELTRKQYLSLAAVRNAGGEARTADVTSSSDDLYNQLVNEHFRQMMDAGLLESLDRDNADGGPTPRQKGYTYRITDKGREVLSSAQEDYGLDPLEEGTVRRRFDRLEGRIGSVEQQVKGQSEGTDVNGDLAEQVEALEERVGEIEELQEDMRNDLKKLAGFVEENREEIGLGGFWDDEENQ